MLVAGGAQRGGVWVVPLLAVRQVLIPVVHDLPALQEIAVADSAMRLGLIGVVDDRVEEHLEGYWRPVPIAGHLGHGGGQVPTGAVPHYRHALAVESEGRRVARHPGRGGVTVLYADGKAVFGREPVVDGDDNAPGGIGDGATDGVVGVEITQHPAPTVEEHRQRGRATDALGTVDPHRNGPIGSRNEVVRDVFDLLTHDRSYLSRGLSDPPPHLGAGNGRVHLWKGGLHVLDDRRGFGVKRHWLPLPFRMSSRTRPSSMTAAHRQGMYTPHRMRGRAAAGQGGGQ